MGVLLRLCGIVGIPGAIVLAYLVQQYPGDCAEVLFHTGLGVAGLLDAIVLYGDPNIDVLPPEPRAGKGRGKPKPAHNGGGQPGHGGKGRSQAPAQSKTKPPAGAQGAAAAGSFGLPRFAEAQALGECSSTLLFGVPDDAITASSSHEHCPPSRSRLGVQGATPTASNGGAWCANTLDDQQWLQWDLQKLKKIVAVQTKGRIDGQQWVTSYSLQYSADSVSWKEINGQFHGNADQFSLRENKISPPILARWVRLRPLGWNAWISMRAELIGCEPNAADLLDQLDKSMETEKLSVDQEMEAVMAAAAISLGRGVRKPRVPKAKPKTNVTGVDTPPRKAKPKTNGTGASIAPQKAKPKTNGTGASIVPPKAKPETNATGADTPSQKARNDETKMSIVNEEKPKRNGTGANTALQKAKPKTNGTGASIVPPKAKPETNGIGASIVPPKAKPETNATGADTPSQKARSDETKMSIVNEAKPKTNGTVANTARHKVPETTPKMNGTGANTTPDKVINASSQLTGDAPVQQSSPKENDEAIGAEMDESRSSELHDGHKVSGNTSNDTRVARKRRRRRKQPRRMES